MKLAFSLFKYFPYGGLQRDCMKIATECVRRGHSVEIFTLQSHGEMPPGVKLRVLPQKKWRNYQRYDAFAAQVVELVKEEQFDALVGFNKMIGLDVYYAADPCYAAKAATRSFLYRKAARTRSFLAAEQAVFGSESTTEILLISAREQQLFQQWYGTKEQRMHLLPPGIQKDRLAAEDYQQQRTAKRAELGLETGDTMLLMVGSGFKTKGLDRSLQAIAALPQQLRNRVQLYVVGQDNIKPFQRMARSLGLERQFHFLAGRDDVAQLLFAADLLLHPAYRENTGTVLLEAMAAMLPVLVSGVCGYSFHIADAQGGIVLDEPFSQQQMNAALAQMLDSTQRVKWQENARKYILSHDVFSMAQRAVDIIEQVTA